MKNCSKPNIYEFLDVSSYLTSFYQYRKSKTASFSYEIWAIELGIKSRSLLRMVVLGQRPITKSFAETLSYGLQLNPNEIKYYFLLVEHTRAKSKQQKNFIWKQMLPLLKSQESRHEIADANFISSHWLPKIQTILSFSDIDRTSETISSLLGLEIEAVQKFLLELEKLAVVKREQQDSEVPTWTTAAECFKVPDSIQNAALKDYYLKSFEDAKQAIDLPPELRRFRSLLIPLSSEEYSELLVKLEDAFQEILLQYKANEFAGRSLFQLNMNLFPIASSQRLSETAIQN